MKQDNRISSNIETRTFITDSNVKESVALIVDEVTVDDQQLRQVMLPGIYCMVGSKIVPIQKVADAIVRKKPQKLENAFREAMKIYGAYAYCVDPQDGETIKGALDVLNAQRRRERRKDGRVRKVSQPITFKPALESV